MSAVEAASRVVSIAAEQDMGEYFDDKGKWKPLSVWAAKAQPYY